MKRGAFFALALLTLLLVGSPDKAVAADALAASEVAQLQQLSNTFVRIAEKITPAVVGISTSRVVRDEGRMLTDPYFRWFFGERDDSPRHREEEGLGSGVLVSAEGVIVTNAHVVEDAEYITVNLSDRRNFRASIVGVDEKTDLAVLRIDAENLPWVPLGDSTRLRAGELVLAVGNPFGLSQTVTMGIISGVGRQGVGISDYEDFIQTDAAINPGNSGGAMINTRGELIGVNTAIFTQSGGYEGIGFAIPSALVKSVMDSLLAHGRVVRGWLGVSIQEISPELAAQFDLPSPTGALITDVIAHGPAAEAGLRRGDVIVAINAKPIDNLSRLRLLVADTEVGSRVAVRVYRDGEESTIHVTLGEMPEDILALPTNLEAPAGGYDNVLSSFTVGELNHDTVRHFQLDPQVLRMPGVVVLEVVPGSAGSRAGVFPGDVIIEVNRQAVDSLHTYTALARSIDAGERVLLLVSRQGQTLYMGVAP